MADQSDFIISPRNGSDSVVPRNLTKGGRSIAPRYTDEAEANRETSANSTSANAEKTPSGPYTESGAVITGQPENKVEEKPVETPAAEPPDWVKPPDWKDFVSPGLVTLNDRGQEVGTFRRDIIVNDIIKNGAPAETVAEYISKHRDSVTVGSYSGVLAVSRALDKGVATVNFGKNEIDIKTVNPPGTFEVDGKAMTLSQVQQLNRQIEDENKKIVVDNKRNFTLALSGFSPEARTFLQDSYEKNPDKAFDILNGLIDKRNKQAERSFDKAINNLSPEAQTFFRDLYKRSPEEAFQAGGQIIEEKNRQISITNKKNFDAAVAKLLPEVQMYLKAAYQKDPSKAFEAANVYISGRNAQLTRDEISRNAFLISIDKFKDDQGNYDIAGYLRSVGSNPVAVEKLRSAFTADAISQAQDYNRQTYGIGLSKWEPESEFVYRYLKEKGQAINYVDINKPAPGSTAVGMPIMIPDANSQRYLSEAQAAYKTEHPNPVYDAFEYAEKYFQDRGWPYQGQIDYNKPGEYKAYREHVRKALDAYREKYGNAAVIGSALGSTLQYAFLPAQALKPNVELADLKASDWLIGAAQAATLALPVVRGALGVGLSIGAGGVFVYDTVKNWSTMGPVAKGFSVAMDALVLLPAVSAGIRALKAVSKGDAAESIIKVEAQNNARMIDRIKKAYGADVAETFEQYKNAQIKYAELKAADLAPQDIVVRGRNIGTNKPTPEMLKTAREELDAAARRFADNLRRGYDSAAGPPPDDPVPWYEAWKTSREGLKEETVSLSRNIANYIDDAIEAAYYGGDAITRQKTILEKAIKALQEIKKKNPNNPEKWTQAEFDVATAQTRYEMAVGSNGAALQERLVNLVKAKDTADNILRFGGNLAKEDRLKVTTIRNKIIRAIADTKAKIKKSISGMEAEWEKNPKTSHGGGRLAVDIRKEIKPLTGEELRRMGARTEKGSRPAAAGTSRVGGAGGARGPLERTAPSLADAVSTMPLPAPLIQEISQIVELPNIRQIELTEIRKRIRQANEEFAKPLSESEVKTISKQLFQEISKTKGMSKTKAEEYLKQAVGKVEIRSAESQETETSPLEEVKPFEKTDLLQRVEPVPPKEKVNPPKPGKPKGGKALRKKGDDEEPWSEEDIESAIAWKDGIVVHAVRSPYRRGIDERTFSVDKLPAGLKVIEHYSGKGSEQRSIKVKGKVPRSLTVDVGNQDKRIVRLKSGRVRISSSLDRGTRTRSDLTVKKHRNLSTKKGRVYHTRMAGGTVLSRRGIRGR